MTSRDKVQLFMFTIYEQVLLEAVVVYSQSLNFTAT